MNSASTKLFNRNFFLLWQGQLVSQIGNQAFMVALAFWIKHETGSATLMGLIMMLSQLPSVLLGPIAGTFADRHSRRKIIIVCDAINGLIVLSLAAVMFLRPEATDTILVWLFVVSIGAATFGAFFRPAVSAAIPDIVPADKVAGANSLNQFSMQLALFLGQGSGGVAYRLLGAPLLFLVDGLTYLFSAVSEMFIKIPQVIPENKHNGLRQKFHEFKSETLEGLRYALNNRGLRSLIIAAALINFFVVPVMVLLPFYVEDFLMATTDWYGFIVAAMGLGSVIGLSAAGIFKVSGRVRSGLMIAALIVLTAAVGGLGLALSKYVAIAVSLMIGVSAGFFNVNVATTMQLTTPSEMRGRVFGLLGTISGGLTPLSMGLSGVVADLLNQNIPLLFILCGVLATLMAIVVSLDPEFRKYMAFEVAKEAPV